MPGLYALRARAVEGAQNARVAARFFAPVSAEESAKRAATYQAQVEAGRPGREEGFANAQNFLAGKNAPPSAPAEAAARAHPAPLSGGTPLMHVAGLVPRPKDDHPVWQQALVPRPKDALHPMGNPLIPRPKDAHLAWEQALVPRMKDLKGTPSPVTQVAAVSAGEHLSRPFVAPLRHEQPVRPAAVTQMASARSFEGEMDSAGLAQSFRQAVQEAILQNVPVGGRGAFGGSFGAFPNTLSGAQRGTLEQRTLWPGMTPLYEQSS